MSIRPACSTNAARFEGFSEGSRDYSRSGNAAGRGLRSGPRISRLALAWARKFVLLVAGFALPGAFCAPAHASPVCNIVSPTYPGGFALNGQACMTLTGTLGSVAESSYPAFVNSGSTLELTPGNAGSYAASAWFNTQQLVAGGFSTSFTFTISEGSGTAGDGIAFLIQNSAPNALANSGCAIGFGDDPQYASCAIRTGGIPHSVAVEFKTYNDGYPEYPNTANSVSIMSNRTGANCIDAACAIAVDNSLGGISLANGSVHSATITYTLQPTSAQTNCGGGTTTPKPCLDVILDGTDLFPDGVFFDLTTIGLAGDRNAWVGFTAGDGSYYDSQEIESWTFVPTGFFGDVNVCSGQTSPAPCSSTLPVTFNFAGITPIGSVQVVTQGATGLDFTPGSGSTCTGAIGAGGSCTVNVNFAPLAPGLRRGAVELFSNDDASTLLATQEIWGIGEGPAAAFSPSSLLTVNSGSSPLLNPKGVAVDATGDVFIADTGNGRVVKVPAGCTGANCQIPITGLEFPQGLAVDGAGNLFVADNNLGEVVKFSPSCTVPTCETTVGSGLNSQLGVAVDGAGNVFISDYNAHEVVEVPVGCTSAACQTTVYNPSSTSPYSNPVGVAVDAAGDVFVADFGLKEIVEIPAGCASSACWITLASGLSEPEGVAVDAAGDVFYTDAGSDEVVELPSGCSNSDCQTVVQTGIESFGVAVDAAGDVFVADLNNARVIELQRSQPPTLGFATTIVGNTSSDSPENFTIQNIGNQALKSATPALVVNGPNFVSVSAPGDCNSSSSFNLTPGGTCNFSISFEPQSVGTPLTSTAVITDNALNAMAATQTVGLSGTSQSPSYTLSVGTAGSGSGIVSGTNCSTGSYAPGTTVTCIETPTGGSQFVGWSGGTCSGLGSCSFSLSSNSTVTANFTLSYTLSVTDVGTGSGTVTDGQGQISCTSGTCSGSYASGTLVTLTASANAPSIFVGWGGACSSFGAGAWCNVTMNSALSVSASFVAPGASQSGTLKPITAGAVYGQGGSFTSNSGNSGGVSANSLYQPSGVAVDGGGNVYVADFQNSRVLYYPAGSTTPTRVYGQGGSFTTGTGNPSVSANTLNNPIGLALDSGGNLYVADWNNNRVLYYPSGSTTATRVYGQGGSFTSNGANYNGVSATSLNGPYGVALDASGNLYVADTYNNRVLLYASGSTTATQVYGQSSFTTSDSGTSASSLTYPFGVALDSSGDLYVADGQNNRVVFYPYNSNTATQVYGQGGNFTTNTANNGGVSAGSLNYPNQVAVDGGGNLYVADYNNNRVLFYPFGSTTATLVYGQSGSLSSSGAQSGANGLSNPAAITLDRSGNLYVADKSNNRVLEYGPFGNVNVCPAGQSAPAPCSSTVSYAYNAAANTTFGATEVVTQGASNLDFTLGGGSTCTGTSVAGGICTVNVNFAPLAPGLRLGGVQLFDNNGNVLASTQVSGVGQAPEVAFGPGVQTTVTSSLRKPGGLAVDAAGNVFTGVYVKTTMSQGTLDNIVKIAPGGAQSVIGGSQPGVAAMAIDGVGNVIVADYGSNQVVKITPSGAQSTVVSGLNEPTGVALDGAGDIFVADTNNSRVLEVFAGGAAQTTVASGLQSPNGVAVDAAGDVFISDGGTDQVVEVPAGCNNAGCQITVASGLESPTGVAVDGAGDVFIADNALGVIEVPAGCTSSACQIFIASNFSNPSSVAVDAAGDIFIGSNGAVIEVNQTQPSALSFALTNAGSTSSDSPQSVGIQNVGNQPLTGSFALNLGTSFFQGSSCTFPLAPGALCYEGFSFTPQSTGYLTGSAVLTDNNLNAASTMQTINLVGTSGVNGQPATVAVPDVTGQTQSAASTTFTAAGLALGTVFTAASPTVPAGGVISESPAAGTQVNVGSSVGVLISTGEPQPPVPNPLLFENNYFVTGDYAAAGVTLRGTGVGGMATGTITIPSSTVNPGFQGVPDGADIIDAFLYWATLENTATASSTNGTFNNYAITGQQIGSDLASFVDGAFTGTLRMYRADVNAYLPVTTNGSGIRYGSGSFTVSLPDGNTALPLTEGASLVVIYRVLSQNFPLKSVVIYDGSVLPASSTTQAVQGFYDAVGGTFGTGEYTNFNYVAGGGWNNSFTTATIPAHASSFTAPLNSGSAYAAVIVSVPVTNSDNDGILDAWKAGPGVGDFHSGQPGYYDVKTATWVPLPGAVHGHKDLFVQLDYMCGAVLSNGQCDPNQENLFPAPDANGNDPLALVTQAFAATGINLHLQIGNIVPETTCTDSVPANLAQLCQFPGQPGVINWKNSLEFSKLWPRNLASCLAGGDCTTRYPYGQKDSYHYVLFGHSLTLPAWNARYGTLTAINVLNGVTTISTVNRGAVGSINYCPSRITISGVLGNPSLNGVYNTTGCSDSMTITVPTPGVPNWSYPNNTLPEPLIGLTSGTVTSISGYSDLGGADSAVTLGLWLTAPNQDMSKRVNVTAGTLYHEIGHTLGLSHGGLYYDGPSGNYIPTFEGNCKPNYQSVMNYLFQLDLVGPNQAVAFSNQQLITLNENTIGGVTQLTDTSNPPNAATFPTSSWYVFSPPTPTSSPATLHCDGTPTNGVNGYRVNAPINPITPPWTNGQDINFIGTLQTQERGYNDAANIDLRQVGATGGEFASLATVLSFNTSSTPLNVGAGGTVALGSGGTVALGSGGTVTLGSGGNVTLGSGGTITLGSGGTVTLGSGGNVTLGSGGTVTPGSSGTVTLGSGGNVTLGSGGTITLGSGGTVTLGSGGTITLGSGGTITLGSGGTVTIPSTGGTYTLPSGGGTITLGSGGNVTLGSGGNVTLGSGGTIALGSGGTVTLGSGGNVTLGSGGTVALGSGGTIALGSGGNVTLGGGGTIALGSGGTITLGSGGNVTLGGGGTVTLGSGGNVALGSGGTVALGSGGTATLGAGGTVTLGSGGNVTLGSGGNVTLGSGGTITLGSGGNVTLGSGGTVTLGSGGTITLGSGGTVTVPPGGSYTINSSGGTITLGSGGNVTLGSGGNVTLGSGGTITLGSGGNITLGSGGTVTLGSGGNVTLGSGGTVTLGSGGNVTLGSGGTITLGSGGNITLGSGGTVTLGSGGSLTNELTYESANSIVRPPPAATETPSPTGVTPAYVRVDWTAPLFGVVATYTVFRSSDGATPIEIGSVSGVNGYPPATEFIDTNPDLVSATVVYTISTTLVPDAPTSSPRQSPPSPPAVLTYDQTITLGALPSSITLSNTPLIVTATAMSSGMPNGLQVNFAAAGSCAVGSQSIAIATGISSASVMLNNTGSCMITASQPGSSSYNAASAVSGTFMIVSQSSTLQSQTITFAPLQSVQYGSSFSLSASSSSGLPVTYTASGPCTGSGTITGIGTCKVTASQLGNSTYSAASSTQSFTIYPAVIKVTATNFAILYGASIPSLTYSYSGFVNNESSSVISGAPALSTTATSASNVGSYPITVTTGTLTASNYSFLYVSGTLTIGQASQTALTLIATSPLTYNHSETLSVTGGSTNGSVTYNLISGPCSISSNQLQATSGTGSCSLTATMAGNGNYNAVTSAATTVTLGLANQTALTLITTTPLAYNQSETLNVTGGTTGGTVTYNLVSGPCSISGNQLKATSGTGSCSVTATMAGNGNYNPVTSAATTVTLGLANQTALTLITTTPLAYNQSETLSVTGGTTGGTVTYNLVSGPCSISGNLLKATSGTGSCSVTATMAGNGNYNSVTSTANTVTLALATESITITSIPASATYASSFTVGYTPGASGDAVSFSSSGGCSNVSATYTMTSGTTACSVTATEVGNNNYANSPTVTKTVAATQATPTLVWPTPAQIVYGTPLSATQLDATASFASQTVPGTFAYTPAAGTVLGQGTQTLSVLFTPSVSANFTTATKSVSLTVFAPTVTLGVTSQTQTYQTWTNFAIGPIFTGSRIPTGTVTLYHNGTALVTLPLTGNGVAYYTASPFNVGANVMTASYSGDSHFAPGVSSPITLTVNPAPVTFVAACSGGTPWTVAYKCTVNVSAHTTVTPGGNITYSLDGATPTSVALSGGSATFTITSPAVGSHTVTINYAAQGNFAAGSTITEKFTTAPGPTALAVSPSSYTPAAGSSVTLSGKATTPCSGVPTGSVTFYDGTSAIGTSAINATTGAVSYTVVGITKGSHSYSAKYAGSTDYAAATSATSVVTAH